MKTFLEGVIFWGYNFSVYENVSICNGYRVSDIFRIGDKILQVGKNSLGGVKIHQVGTSETVRYVRSSS